MSKPPVKQAVIVRLTTDAFSKNLGVDYRTITKGLRANEVQPDADGKYSLRDLCGAAFGDTEAAKLRNLNLDAELKEREKAQIDRELVPVRLVMKTWENGILGMRQIIVHSPLAEEDKRKVLAELRNYDLEEYFETANEDGEE